MTNFIVDILQYFFGFNPPIQFGLQWIAWVFAAAGVLAAIYLIFVQKTLHNPVLRKSTQAFPGILITISVLLSLNIFSRLYRVQVLSMRIITYLLIAWMIFNFYQLYRALTTKVVKEKEKKEHSLEHLEKKYHIHRNKKRKTLTR